MKISVWFDECHNGPGCADCADGVEQNWIVSLDQDDDCGPSDTLSTHDDREDAINAAQDEADKRYLPIEILPRRVGGDDGRMIPAPACLCTGCGCDEPATGTDDAGVNVCDECADYSSTEDGDVICSRMTEGGKHCHACGGTIDWSHIQTRQGGGNFRMGACTCGPEAWRDEERGSNNWTQSYNAGSER